MNPPVLTRMEHDRADHAGMAVVNWCLGNACNYACSYCPDSLHDGSIPWTPTAQVLAFCDRLLAHYRDGLGRKVYVEFTGGEPTLNRDFPAVLGHLKERGAHTGAISNGSLPLRWWERNSGLLDHICLSFHPESASPERFLEVVAYMHSRVATHINVMMIPERFDLCMDVAERAAGLVENTSISLQPVFEKLVPCSPLKAYTPEQNRLLVEKSFGIPWNRPTFSYRGGMRVSGPVGPSRVVEAPHFIATGANRWKGWKCWAGVDGLVIYADGSIYRGWCKQDRVGNVSDPAIAFPAAPTLCRRDACHCNLDIMNRREAPAAA